MATSSGSITSPSLILRLRDTSDRQAWEEFVERYGGRIYGWCRRNGLQNADADDVTEEVLLRMAKRLPTFSYDPSRGFRKYLKTVANNVMNELFRDLAQRPKPSTGDSQVLDLLNQVKARKDLQRQMELAELIYVAEERVRPTLKGNSWEVYRLLLKDGCSPSEVASRFKMEISAVNMVKCRVLGKLRVELKRLDSSLDSLEGVT